jgi:hypothetical protein
VHELDARSQLGPDTFSIFFGQCLALMIIAAPILAQISDFAGLVFAPAQFIIAPRNFSPAQLTERYQS